MKLEVSSYILRIDGNTVRRLGWTPNTEIETSIVDGKLVVSAIEVPVRRTEGNGNGTETQKAIDMLMNRFKGKRFTTEDAAGILSIDREDAAKIISYGKTKGIFESEEHPQDKRLRVYSVVPS